MCDCTTCKYTDAFGKLDGKLGFADWPRGEITGPRKARAEYAAHVSRSHFDVLLSRPINLDPVSAYGVPAGLTRADVLAVLRRTFAQTEETTE